MINTFLNFNLSRAQLIIVVLSFLLGAWCYPYIVSNVNKLSDSMITGKISYPCPGLLYEVMRKKRPAGFKYITTAEDFASVYATAKHLDRPDIYTGKYDFAKRPVPYPPFLFYLCNKFFDNIYFPLAALYFIFLQVTLLIISSYWILHHYRLGIIILPVTVFYCFVLFLTPLGLTWFERGQFDIYPALAILFFLFGVYEKKAYAFVMSGLFFSLKYTAIILFVQAFIIYLLIYRNNESFKFFCLFIGTLLLTLVFFPRQLVFDSFLALYKFQNHPPDGVTLAGKMPYVYAGVLSALSVLCYMVASLLRKNEGFFLKTLLPFLTALLAFDLLLPNRGWEYRFLCFLGFVPMLLPWAMKYKDDRIYNSVFIILFALFLMIGFHAYRIFFTIPEKEIYFTAIYAAYFIVIGTVSILKLCL